MVGKGMMRGKACGMVLGTRGTLKVSARRLLVGVKSRLLLAPPVK